MTFKEQQHIEHIMLIAQFMKEESGSNMFILTVMLI